MEDKDRQLPPSTSLPQPPTNGVSLNTKIDENQGEQDEKVEHQTNLEVSGKKPRIGSPSNDNAATLNNQNPPNFQGSYTFQPVNEKQAIAAATFPSFSPSPVITNQWQPQIQLNAGFQQAQQFQPPPHLVSSNPPGFWLPQRPNYQPQGGQSLGPGQPQTQMGPVDSSSQFPAGNGQMTMPGNPGQVPRVFYQFGPPHATYSAGPWDPSSCWGQMQSPPFCVYPPFPGAFNYFPQPAPQPVTNCTAASEQSSQKGVIRPSVKISQKHQVLWEAQSAENVQLWSVITALQAELAEFKTRLTKLETETKSVKSSGEQLAAHETGNISTGHATKRGRPRKVVSSVDTLSSPNDPHPRPRGRRPALTKAPPEIKEINFQKDDKNKVEFIETVSPLVNTSQHPSGEKFTSFFTSSSSPIEASSGEPAYQNPSFPNISQIQRGKVPPNSSSKANGAQSMSQDQFKKLIGEMQSAAYLQTISNRDHGWTSNVPPGYCASDMMNAISEGLYSHGNTSGQAKSAVAPWGPLNENDDASEDLDEATAESDKEDVEDKENVTSTCSEGISQAKNEGPHSANGPEDGNPPGFLSW